MKESYPPAMTTQEFDKVIQESLSKIHEVLVVKAKEYRRNENPFHNFDIAARIKNETREEALYGMFIKHFVSIGDIREDVKKNILPTKELVEEKYTDAINYLLL